MRPITVTVGPLDAASANAICLSQTPSAGPLTLNGATVVDGVAVLDTARRVLITAASNESAKTFTITGTNWSGAAISETIAGPNATTAYTALDFKTVTSITISATAAGAVQVGTNNIASSAWARMDDWAPTYVSIQCNSSGTVDFTVQSSLDDPNSPSNPVDPADCVWIDTNDSLAVGASASLQTNYFFAPAFLRILLNSGDGTVTATFTQHGAS